jgi:hypothetical protein
MSPDFENFRNFFWFFNKSFSRVKTKNMRRTRIWHPFCYIVP